jgi:hypothetical protein
MQGADTPPWHVPRARIRSWLQQHTPVATRASQPPVTTRSNLSRWLSEPPLLAS